MIEALLNGVARLMGMQPSALKWKKYIKKP